MKLCALFVSAHFTSKKQLTNTILYGIIYALINFISKDDDGECICESF